MLRDKIKTLVNRYDQRAIRLDMTYRDTSKEKHTAVRGEIYEYKYMVNQLVRALDTSTYESDLSIFIFEILQTELIREKNFKGSSLSSYDNDIEYKGRADACFKIIQDLKGVLPKYKKSLTPPPLPPVIRHIEICRG